jgi:hypothetical protein
VLLETPWLQRRCIFWHVPAACSAAVSDPAQIHHKPQTQHAGSKRAAARFYYQPDASTGIETGYELLSDAAKGTVTVALSNNEDPKTTLVVNVTQCTATFKLVAGYAFDLTPPAGATCANNAVPVELGGRSFCKFCPVGQYKKASAGMCAPCAAGSYQDQVGSTSCKACPPGSKCDGSGNYQPLACSGGFHSPNAGAVACKQCPANTYGNKFKGATSCTPCPRFTVAPKGSSACYVPPIY